MIPVEPPSEPFRAGKAFLCLGLVILAQIVVGVVIVIVAKVIKPGMIDPMKEPDLVTAMIFIGGLATAAATLGAARLWAWPLVRDRTLAGLGLFLPRPATILLCAALGAALSCAYLAIALWVIPAGPDVKGGPMAQAAGRGGLSRLAWALMAVVIAPPGEELLFRGMLLKGLAASWGMAWASIVATLIFVALHLTETIHYWPANLFILVMAITALAIRLRTGSVVASMAFHAAYNGVIVTAVYLSPASL